MIKISEDTDVFVILLWCIQRWEAIEILIAESNGNKTRLIDVTNFFAMLDKDVYSALIGLHGWTGCDTGNFIVGRGQKRLA